MIGVPRFVALTRKSAALDSPVYGFSSSVRYFARELLRFVNELRLRSLIELERWRDARGKETPI